MELRRNYYTMEITQIKGEKFLDIPKNVIWMIYCVYTARRQQFFTN